MSENEGKGRRSAGVLDVGKLPAPLLEKLLGRYASNDPRVLLGPRPGEDAAIIEMGDRCLVAKTDPITFATDEIGWYAVHVNANDVACCGAEPRWFLATVLLPEGQADERLVAGIFEQMAGACAEIGATLCGGHTEITFGLDRPIVVGQMLGETEPGRYVTTGGARTGDVLLLTKSFALEGTAILARELAGEAAGDDLDAGTLARCAGLLHDPGISVVRDARAALAAGGVNALHDPTEGGLATGLHEVARACGLGLSVERAALPLHPDCERLCARLGLDPLGLIASGSLLVAVEPGSVREVAASLEAAGIACARIGEMGEPGGSCKLREPDGSVVPLPAFARDEIARAFG